MKKEKYNDFKDILTATLNKIETYYDKTSLISAYAMAMSMLPSYFEFLVLTNISF
jgi:hypothetical protein